MSTTGGPEGARPQDEPQAPSAEPQAAGEASKGGPPTETTAGETPAGLTPPANDAAAPQVPPPPPRVLELASLRAFKTVAEQRIAELEGEIERLKSEPGEYQERNVRLLAEMENLRRRTEREKADTAKYAITRFARDMLTVADNIERAIGAVPREAISDEGPFKSFHEGVALTERVLLNVLERHGVKRLDPLNQRFDPNLHQAMMEVENTAVENGTVVQVFQPAYVIEDRVLRPAMVVVSRGGPKPVKAAEAQANSEGTGEATTGGEAPGNPEPETGPTS